MFKNMSVSLIEHEVIKTTLPKAKELRRVIEPLITLAKQDSVANRRLAFSRTRSKEAVGKLFNELGPRYAERPGGYVRILKCGFRTGDNAPMAFVELVDRPVVEEVEEAAAEECSPAAGPARQGCSGSNEKPGFSRSRVFFVAGSGAIWPQPARPAGSWLAPAAA